MRPNSVTATATYQYHSYSYCHCDCYCCCYYKMISITGTIAVLLTLLRLQRIDSLTMTMPILLGVM